MSRLSVLFELISAHCGTLGQIPQERLNWMCSGCLEDEEIGEKGGVVVEFELFRLGQSLD